MTPFTLSRSYSVGSETFSTIVFRAPALPDYREIGPVVEMQRNVVLRDRQAIWSYVDRLVTSPAPGALAVLDVGDTMALEDHVVAFFIEARASRARRMNSSSGSDGAPKP